MLSKHFSREEFQCSCGCGGDTVDYALVEVLEDVREYFNTPIVINSGYRCACHNADIGGSTNSQHIRGKAADFRVVGIPEEEVVSYLESLHPNEYGIGVYQGRVHIDVRSPKARWEA